MHDVKGTQPNTNEDQELSETDITRDVARPGKYKSPVWAAEAAGGWPWHAWLA